MTTIGKQIADFFSTETSTANDDGLRGLFINELKGIYYAEKTLLENMPGMADAATTDQVRQAFQVHQEESRNQVTRLEGVFQSINEAPETMTCNAVDGLADDANNVIGLTEAGSLTRDAALIIAAQKVEHHEIAAYGSLHALAELLGYTEAAQLIEQTLQEEKNTDKKLTQLAETFVNERAKSEGNTDSNYLSPNRRNQYDDMPGTGNTISGGTSRENSGSSIGREGSSGNATSGGMMGI